MSAVSMARKFLLIAAVIPLTLLCACDSVLTTKGGLEVTAEEVLRSTDAVKLRSEISVSTPEASRDKVYSSDGITLDYSNASDGYVMMKNERKSDGIKTRIAADGTAYTYDLPSDGEYATFILSEGSGSYEISLFEQVEGSTYSVLFRTNVESVQTDETRPFLFPNQYVRFDEHSDAVLWAYAACDYAGADNDKEELELLYKYVADNIKYDQAKADSVQPGYLPDIDETLSSGTGICFDYSSLLAAMLRSRGVPTKLITGYLSPEDIYHAWNMAYIDGQWVFRDSTLAGERRGEDAYAEDKEY